MDDGRYYEVRPLPPVCQGCMEEDCWECDHALERWQPTDAYVRFLKEKAEQKSQRRQWHDRHLGK